MAGRAGHTYLFRDRPSPKEGTYSRTVFDLAETGKPIITPKDHKSQVKLGMTITRLRDFHGFDIVHESKGVYRAVGRTFASGVYIKISPQN